MRRRIATLVVLLGAACRVASADERVPLGDNFSPAEEITIGAMVATDVSLFALQSTFADLHDPFIGPPPSFDRSISDFFYRGPTAGPWLAGVPDKTGLIVAPVVTFSFYAADSLFLHLRGTALTGDENADHKLLALVEAYAVTMGVDQLAKLTIGRERPIFYLDRPQAGPHTSDSDLSFYSGHSTSSFCLAAFVQRDLSDWLIAHPLASSTPATQLWLGRVLPAAVLYGVATTIAFSRVVDQEHYASDVVVGAIMGTFFGNLFYSLHFDQHGQPRRRPNVQLTAFPAGVGLSGSF